MSTFKYNGRHFFLASDSGALTVFDIKSGTRVTDMLTDQEHSAAMAGLIAGHAGSFYVWGRQDAGESVKDTGVSRLFGAAYAAHVYRYRSGDHCSMSPVQDAYEAWLAGKLELDAS